MALQVFQVSGCPEVSWVYVINSTNGRVAVGYRGNRRSHRCFSQPAPPGPESDLYVLQAVIVCQRRLSSEASAPKIQHIPGYDVTGHALPHQSRLPPPRRVNTATVRQLWKVPRISSPHISFSASTHHLHGSSLSSSYFLASSGSGKQESSPNDGIKKSEKWQRRREKRECDRQLLAPQHPQTLSSGKKKKIQKKKGKKDTARDSVLLARSLCLFLAAALLPSFDQTSGVEG